MCSNVAPKRPQRDVGVPISVWKKYIDEGQHARFDRDFGCGYAGRARNVACA